MIPGVDHTLERDDSLEMAPCENLQLVGVSLVSFWKCPTNRGPSISTSSKVHCHALSHSVGGPKRGSLGD